MERWSGKVALVTGASAGIGASIAEELGKQGVKVVAIARRVECIEELKKNVGDIKGEIIPMKGDISKEEDIEAVFKFIKEKFGAIHILVNNAGIARRVTIIDGDVEHFKNVMGVNFLGLTICIQKALRLMKEAGVEDGHIININSIVGHYVPNMGPPLANVYPSSKHAVTALTETLRQELTFFKSKIRVTSISPGAVKTGILFASAEALGQNLNEEMKKIITAPPKLQPKDIADAAIFALSAPPHVQINEMVIRPLGGMF